MSQKEFTAKQLYTLIETLSIMDYLGRISSSKLSDIDYDDPPHRYANVLSIVTSTLSSINTKALKELTDLCVKDDSGEQ